jgi:hypothetical protein
MAESEDGKTYLIVADDNDEVCAAIRVDGMPWLHPIGQANLINPGAHSITCGGEIEFHIPGGTVYTFDNWTP